MTKDETKVILSWMVDLVAEMTEHSLRAHEMAWRTYAALVRMHPNVFVGEYQSDDKGISFVEINQKRLSVLAKLDHIKQRLQD